MPFAYYWKLGATQADRNDLSHVSPEDDGTTHSDGKKSHTFIQDSDPIFYRGKPSAQEASQAVIL